MRVEIKTDKGYLARTIEVESLLDKDWEQIVYEIRDALVTAKIYESQGD